MLIQNTITDLEKKKTISQMLSFSLLLPFSPQTTFNFSPYRKSEDNLKLNDGGSAFKAPLKRKEGKASHCDGALSEGWKLSKEAQRSCWPSRLLGLSVKTEDPPKHLSFFVC